MRCLKSMAMAACMLAGASTCWAGEPSRKLKSEPMRVEEPTTSPKSGFPIEPAREKGQWRKKAGDAARLTESQKRSLLKRRERMEKMVSQIQERRRALREANPQDRKIVARELHVLMLEKGPAAEDAGQGEAGAGAGQPVNPIRPPLKAPAAMAPERVRRGSETGFRHTERKSENRKSRQERHRQGE